MVLYTSVFFQVISLLYIVLVFITFMIKKKIDSAENNIFLRLSILGIFSCIFDIVSVLISFQYPNALISKILCKFYLVTLLGFAIVYTEYADIIIDNTLNNEAKLEKYNKIKIFMLIFYIVVSSIVCMMPINIYVKGTSMMYSYGLASTITYSFCGFCMILWIALLVVRARYVAPRKTLPIVSIILFGGLTAIVQLFNPELLLVTSAVVFSVAIMYFSVFTIENPDLEMVDEIKVARNQAIKASQAKTDFLSSMSHELRTPLNAILGFSQGLLEQDNLAPDVKEDVEDIVSASDTLLELVNEILDISKIESDKFEIVNVEYPVHKVYKYLVTMTEGRIGSKQLEFIHEYDDAFPPVLYGDCVRLKQVIVNLLTNAVKYTKEGYVKLVMKYEKIDEDNGYFIASVSDSGIGIKEEDKSKLFSKFERFDLKDNITIEGTGLGLALTKKLVDLMGGEITVESNYGVGSCFSVKIKQGVVHKSIDQVENENPLLTRGNFKGNGERILIADDNGVNLKVASRLLKSYHLKLDLVSSGKECLNKIAAGNQYQLIMLDDQMPEMTGIETLHLLKSNPTFKTPVVVLTANAISGMKEKYLSEGFDGYISKPIDKILLEETLEEFLGNGDHLNSNVESQNSNQAIGSSFSNGSNANVSTGSVADEKFSRSFLENSGVNLSSALEFLGDIETYNDTALDVYQDSFHKMEQLKKLLAAKDMANYSVVAHALKSDAKYMGMKRLSDISYNHELASKNNDIKYVTAYFSQLQKEEEKMMDVLRRYLGK